MQIKYRCLKLLGYRSHQELQAELSSGAREYITWNDVKKAMALEKSGGSKRAEDVPALLEDAAGDE